MRVVRWPDEMRPYTVGLNPVFERLAADEARDAHVAYWTAGDASNESDVEMRKQRHRARLAPVPIRGGSLRGHPSFFSLHSIIEADEGVATGFNMNGHPHGLVVDSSSKTLAQERVGLSTLLRRSSSPNSSASRNFLHEVSYLSHPAGSQVPAGRLCSYLWTSRINTMQIESSRYRDAGSLP
nr:hypothetical protein CFP56_11520 [Quercus suber]